MEPLAPARWNEVRPLLGDDRTGLVLAPHTFATGRGAWWTDRRSSPRAAVVFAGGALGLAGDLDAVDPAQLGLLLGGLLVEWDRVFVEAPDPAHEAKLRASFAPLQRGERVHFTFVARAADPPRVPDGAVVRLLAPDDAAEVTALEPELHWIWDPWDDAVGLAASGRARGAFVDGRLAALAAVLYVGADVDELGVVTRLAFRRKGLCGACAAQAVDDSLRLGRRPG
ncbi:MAG: hypothetical protein R3263_12745, partial [Myxococcota bacterium]|nr:hypothetical protein [Myxococcota bacterium]